MFLILLPILAIVGIGSGLRFRDNVILSTWQLWIIIGVPIYGAFVGNLQWETLLNSFISRKQWILTSAISTAMGVASFFLALDNLPPLQLLLANGERTVSNTWFITILGLGLITGTSIGLPYWYILRGKLYANQLFIVILGSVFAAFMCAFVFDSLIEFYYFAPFEFFCTGPIFVSLAMGVMLRRILERKRVA
jgi:hypothetical protein